MALLQYRATPLASTGYSPAQLLMGRRIATNLPMKMTKLKPKVPNRRIVNERISKYKRGYANAHDRKFGAHKLSKLRPGDFVRLKTDSQSKWSAPARVVSRSNTPRSFNVQNPDGSVMRRNRRHLLRVPTPSQPCVVPASRPDSQATTPVPTTPAPTTVPVLSPNVVARTPTNPAQVPPRNTPVCPPPTPLRPQTRRQSARPTIAPKRLIEEMA